MVGHPGRRRRPSARTFLWGRQEGSAVTEFALIIPVFFLIVYAILAFGRAYQRLNVLTGALRDGARFASAQFAPCGSLPAVRARVGLYAGGFGMALDTSQVDVACAGASVSVGVTNYALFSDLNLFGLDAQTVTRSAVFRCEVESSC